MTITNTSLSFAHLVSSGDLRQPANIAGWPAQSEFEATLHRVFMSQHCELVRLHQFDPERGHGFIDSQRMGLDLLTAADPAAPLVVATTIWQYSHHLVGGLQRRTGPLLLCCNWDGHWSGVVGTLNLSASLEKFGIEHSLLMYDKHAPERFEASIAEWVSTGAAQRPAPYRQEIVENSDERALAVADELWRERPILTVFDEGCMGMLNAIVDDAVIARTPFLKERVSQSALVAEMLTIADSEAEDVLAWVEQRGMTFDWSTDDSGLTRDQVLSQCKMYIAAVRIADDFGSAAVGIQYQQGLKDVVPASDFAEGLLNNAERPPVRQRDGGSELYEGGPLPHFNEVDECAGIDAVVTNRLWVELGMDPASTLHDIRFGGNWDGQFVWTFMISGAAPASHLTGGYAGAHGFRQQAIFFPLGGSTLQGVGKPGEIVWSRVYTSNGVLSADVGVGRVLELPLDETLRRQNATSPEWPIVHATLHGVDRDQLISHHHSNHIQLAYVDEAADPFEVARMKAAVFSSIGIVSHLCGFGAD